MHFHLKGSRIVLWFSEILSISFLLAMKWFRNHITWAHSKTKHLNANIVRKNLLCCWLSSWFKEKPFKYEFLKIKWLRNHLAWAHNEKNIWMQILYWNIYFFLLFLELMIERSYLNVTFVTKKLRFKKSFSLGP